MCCELTITVKDNEKTLKTKHLVYETFCMNQDEPVIQELIADTIKQFKGTPDRVRVTSKFEVQ